MAKLPASMKALVKDSPGPSYVYKDVPVPVPRGDELLVRVGKVALCGSGIALHQWNNGTIYFCIHHHTISSLARGAWERG